MVACLLHCPTHSQVPSLKGGVSLPSGAAGLDVNVDVPKVKGGGLFGLFGGGGKANLDVDISVPEVSGSLDVKGPSFKGKGGKAGVDINLPSGSASVDVKV